jgi:cation transporter-like permease
MDTWVNNPTMHETSVPAIGIGFLTAFVLGVIRQQVPGFPLHPVGYAVSSSWSLAVLWVPLLIAWAIKSTILRIGGLAAYRRALPFFLGLIVGECVAGSFWTLLGLATGLPIYGFYPY